MTHFRSGAIVMGALCLMLGACQSYTLRGRVVQGDVSYVVLVDRDDPRLTGPGMAGVRLDVTIDPGRLNRSSLPSEMSGASGELSILVRKPGAGFLKYEASLLARYPGFQTAEGVFDLPKKSRRVLVVLAPGTDPTGLDSNRTIEDDLRQFRR